MSSIVQRKHTLAAAKICWTAADISGPMPSPGINVTICVYLSKQDWYLCNME